jgi:outer membrane protein assembly factor BamB
MTWLIGFLMLANLVRPAALPRGTTGPRLGFVATLGGSVVALDLASGRPVWSREITGTPWIAGPEVVVVAAPRPPGVALTVLGAHDGSMVRELALAVPAELAAPAGDFDLELGLSGSTLEIAWRLPGRYAGGAPPPTFVREREAGELAGAARCDLTSGSVVPLPVERGPAVGESWPYRRRGTWRETGWTVGERTLRLAFEGGTLWLQRDGPGETRSALGTAAGFEPVVTPCGRFLFVRATKPAGPWAVFSLPDGRRLGNLDWPAEAQLPTVVGERAFCLHSSLLLATDIATGRTVWRFDLGPGAPAAVPDLPR